MDKKKVLGFALGGHIATQNASFKELARILEPNGYEFYGGKDGFDCFRTREVYQLSSEEIPIGFAGFISSPAERKLPCFSSE